MKTINTLRITEGFNAIALLNEAAFIQQWRELEKICPWSTVYQSPEFVTTWYETYSKLYSPVLLAEYTNDDRLTGLLTLAIDLDRITLVYAGAHQAEYQTWISQDEGNVDFAKKLMATLQRHFPAQSLNLKYLPRTLPIHQLQNEVFLKSLVEFKTHPCPINENTEANIQERRNKKHNKNRMNRLKRIGETQLEIITCPDRFASVVDDFILRYDFRQGAVNQSTPFQEDPLKKIFHINLMKHKDLMHVSVLRAGEHFVAGNIGIRDGEDRLIMCIPANTPYNASKLSPFRLLFMLLCEELLERKVSTIDLTPGGDPWKEEVATAHERVYEMTFYPNKNAFHTMKAQEASLNFLKRILKTFNLTPNQLRILFSKVKRFRINTLFSKIKNLCWEKGDLRFYAYSAQKKPLICPALSTRAL